MVKMVIIEEYLEDSWADLLNEEFSKQYFIGLSDFLNREYKINQIFPKQEHIFEAYKLCSFKDTKVVILGLDPYINENQAHGLAFSVEGEKFPPSLKNIFKELCFDIGCNMPSRGNLSRWAEQGVLLLNTILTVQKGVTLSHKARGWEEFTDATIELLSRGKRDVVFILWGERAQRKASLIDSKKHYILKSPHPSPLSAYRGFFNSKPFTKTNSYLRSNSIKQIEWSLNDE